MGNYNLPADNPGFYTKKRKWEDFTKMWSGGFAPNHIEYPREFDEYLKNFNNFRAFAITNCPPRNVNASEEVENAGVKIPGYNPKRTTEERQQRKQLSDKAFENAIIVAYKKQKSMASFASTERHDYIFLQLGDDENTLNQNQIEWEIRNNGTPQQRSEQVDRRVRESLDLFERCVNRDIGDEEVIDRLAEMHRCQDLTANAQMLLKDEKLGKIVLSDETRQILKRMEKHQAIVDIYLKRARAIMNPLYEEIDIDPLLDLSEDEMTDLSEQADENGAKILDDLLSPLTVATTDLNTEKRVTLHDKILEDFNVESHRPTVQIITRDNTIVKDLFDLSGKKDRRDRDLGYSYVLVTAQDDRYACYRINKDTTVDRVTPEDMQQEYINNLRTDVATALGDLKKANKGFFIGSRAYSQAMKAMTQVDKAIKKLDNPPTVEQMDALKALLSDAATKCSLYLSNKRPENLTKSREKNRYNAVKKALNICKKSLVFHELQDNALDMKNGYANPCRDPEEEKNVYDCDVIKEYIDENYPSALIPESNVGDCAEILKRSISRLMNNQLYYTEVGDMEFNPNEAKVCLAKAVLLEMMMDGRKFGENNTIVAGDVEEQYATNPDGMLEGILNNPRFQSMTDNLDRDKMYSLVMHGAVKNFKNVLMNAAQMPKPSLSDPAKNLQMENDLINN